MRIMQENEVNSLLAELNSLYNAQLKALAIRRKKKKEEKIEPPKEVIKSKGLDLLV